MGALEEVQRRIQAGELTLGSSPSKGSALEEVNRRMAAGDFDTDADYKQMAGQSATVMEVLDGDTAIVRTDKGRYARIRLQGIDTPETDKGAAGWGEEGGVWARQRFQKDFEGKTVTIGGSQTTDNRDPYGRMLADIELPDGTSASATMGDPANYMDQRGWWDKIKLGNEQAAAAIMQTRHGFGEAIHSEPGQKLLNKTMALGMATGQPANSIWAGLLKLFANSQAGEDWRKSNDRDIELIKQDIANRPDFYKSVWEPEEGGALRQIAGYTAQAVKHPSRTLSFLLEQSPTTATVAAATAMGTVAAPQVLATLPVIGEITAGNALGFGVMAVAAGSRDFGQSEGLSDEDSRFTHAVLVGMGESLSEQVGLLPEALAFRFAKKAAAKAGGKTAWGLFKSGLKGAGEGYLIGGSEEAVAKINENLWDSILFDDPKDLLSDVPREFAMGAIGESTQGAGGAMAGHLFAPNTPAPPPGPAGTTNANVGADTSSPRRSTRAEALEKLRKGKEAALAVAKTNPKHTKEDLAKIEALFAQVENDIYAGKYDVKIEQAPDTPVYQGEQNAKEVQTPQTTPVTPTPGTEPAVAKRRTADGTEIEDTSLPSELKPWMPEKIAEGGLFEDKDTVGPMPPQTVTKGPDWVSEETWNAYIQGKIDAKKVVEQTLDENLLLMDQDRTQAIEKGVATIAAFQEKQQIMQQKAQLFSALPESEKQAQAVTTSRVPATDPLPAPKSFFVKPEKEKQAEPVVSGPAKPAPALFAPKEERVPGYKINLKPKERAKFQMSEWDLAKLLVDMSESALRQACREGGLHNVDTTNKAAMIVAITAAVRAHGGKLNQARLELLPRLGMNQDKTMPTIDGIDLNRLPTATLLKIADILNIATPQTKQGKPNRATTGAMGTTNRRTIIDSVKGILAEQEMQTDESREDNKDVPVQPVVPEIEVIAPDNKVADEEVNTRELTDEAEAAAIKDAIGEEEDLEGNIEQPYDPSKGKYKPEQDDNTNDTSVEEGLWMPELVKRLIAEGTFGIYSGDLALQQGRYEEITDPETGKIRHLGVWNNTAYWIDEQTNELQEMEWDEIGSADLRDFVQDEGGDIRDTAWKNNKELNERYDKKDPDIYDITDEVSEYETPKADSRDLAPSQVRPNNGVKLRVGETVYAYVQKKIQRQATRVVNGHHVAKSTLAKVATPPKGVRAIQDKQNGGYWILKPDMEEVDRGYWVNEKGEKANKDMQVFLTEAYRNPLMERLAALANFAISIGLDPKANARVAGHSKKTGKPFFHRISPMRFAYELRQYIASLGGDLMAGVVNPQVEKAKGEKVDKEQAMSNALQGNWGLSKYGAWGQRHGITKLGILFKALKRVLGQQAEMRLMREVVPYKLKKGSTVLFMEGIDKLDKRQQEELALEFVARYKRALRENNIDLVDQAKQEEVARALFDILKTSREEQASFKEAMGIGKKEDKNWGNDQGTRAAVKAAVTAEMAAELKRRLNKTTEQVKAEQAAIKQTEIQKLQGELEALKRKTVLTPAENKAINDKTKALNALLDQKALDDMAAKSGDQGNQDAKTQTIDDVAKEAVHVDAPSTAPTMTSMVDADQLASVMQGLYKKFGIKMAPSASADGGLSELRDWRGKKAKWKAIIRGEVKRLQDAVTDALGVSHYDVYSDKKVFGDYTTMDVSRALYTAIQQREYPAWSSFLHLLSPSYRKAAELAQQINGNPTNNEVLRKLNDVVEKTLAFTDKVGKIAVDAGLIEAKDVRQYYITEMWDFKKSAKEFTSKLLATRPGQIQHRLFEGGVFEGMAKGGVLKWEDFSEAVYQTALSVTEAIENRKYINLAIEQGIFAKEGKGTPPGYKRIDSQVIQYKTKNGSSITLYAPEKIANSINKEYGKSRIAGIWGVPALTWLTQRIKEVILTASGYQAQEYIAMSAYGTPNTKSMFVHKNLKEGKEILRNLPSIDQFARNEVDRAEDLYLEIVEASLVDNLALDFDPSYKRAPELPGRIAQKIPGLKQIWNAIAFMGEGVQKLTFEHLGPALKAHAAVQLARIELTRNADKIMSGQTTRKEVLRAVAKTVNNQFGGLNYVDLDIGQTAQHLMKLGIFGHDFTLANARRYTQMGAKGPEGSAARRMMAAVAVKYGLLWLMGNLGLAMADDEGFIERLKLAWKNGGLSSMNILFWDITPIYKLFGGKTKNRKYLNILSSFKEGLRWLTSATDAKALGNMVRSKSAFLPRMAMDYAFAYDFAGKPFTTTGELFGKERGKFGDNLKGQIASYQSKGEKGLLDREQFPSFALYEAKSALPIGAQNVIDMLRGEIEPFDAVLGAFGTDTRTSYEQEKREPKLTYKKFLQDSGMPRSKPAQMMWKIEKGDDLQGRRLFEPRRRYAD
jgi:endonuclease YncB( thermonuclease family)